MSWPEAIFWSVAVLVGVPFIFLILVIIGTGILVWLEDRK